jgi:hypothetical protein
MRGPGYLPKLLFCVQPLPERGYFGKEREVDFEDSRRGDVLECVCSYSQRKQDGVTDCMIE